ncbi:hypothetical protein A3Q56_00879 [Intoshia linei]|uniref:CUE domain-containing protein n=1 Tax=Intoshia linei TaxID=1819745 RepID=A0A177BAR8_9BILA|nr:hypothetical protein A3Q56_00879 [Intoshia linei]
MIIIIDEHMTSCNIYRTFGMKNKSLKYVGCGKLENSIQFKNIKTPVFLNLNFEDETGKHTGMFEINISVNYQKLRVEKIKEIDSPILDNQIKSNKKKKKVCDNIEKAESKIKKLNLNVTSDENEKPLHCENENEIQNDTNFNLIFNDQDDELTLINHEKEETETEKANRLLEECSAKDVDADNDSYNEDIQECKNDLWCNKYTATTQLVLNFTTLTIKSYFKMENIPQRVKNVRSALLKKYRWVEGITGDHLESGTENYGIDSDLESEISEHLSEFQQKINGLKSKFPNLDRITLETALEDNRNNVDETIDMLKQFEL